MSLRAFRFAVVLCAPRVVAEEAPPGKTESGAEAVTPPRLLHAEPALVPDGEAASEAVPVTLALTIDEKGQVTEATIIDSGGERFDESALAAVKSFEFEPARRKGLPLAAKIRYRYVFPAPTSPTPDAAPSASPPALGVQTPATQPDVAPLQATPKTSLASGEPEEFSEIATVEAPPREVTRRSISEEMLTEMPGTRGDALRAIEVMPGVGRTSLNNGDPILRGAGQDESQTFLNGVPVPFLYHFGGLTSFFGSRNIERIDLYPGNFSTRYGRVSGGVIEVRSKDPRMDGFHAGFDLNLIDSSAFVNSSVGPKAGFAHSARRSNIDLVFSKLVPKDTYSVVAAPLYWDYQALATCRFNAQNTLRVIGYGSRDSLKLLFSNPNEKTPH